MLWEEKKYTRLKMKNMKPTSDGNVNGIIGILPESNEIECCVIGTRKVWKRKCPECHDNIVSDDKWYCKDAHLRRRLCKKCRIKGCRNPNYGVVVSDERKEKQRQTLSLRPPTAWYWYGKHLSEEHKKKLSDSHAGKKLTSHHKDCIRVSMRGNSHRKGIPHSEDARRKLRLAQAQYAMRNAGTKICPAFNERACQYFDWLNKWNGWNGRYATNGGEYFVKDLGYWVDYYEPSTNTVIEWDEYKRHYKDGKLREKDFIRMNRIKEALHCRFYRMNEKTNEIMEY